LGLSVLVDKFKKPIELILYRLFLWSSQPLWKAERLIIAIAAVFFIETQLAIPAYSFEKVSLKKYKAQAVKVDNPVDLTQLKLNKTFQVNSPDFVLQFFFSGPDVLGIILKRNLDKALFIRWCFFRNCEESQFDFTSVIAQPHGPPLANGFFETKFPPGLSYRFQGMHFFTRK